MNLKINLIMELKLLFLIENNYQLLSSEINRLSNESEENNF